MAILKVVTPSGFFLIDCDLPLATTMHYAAKHAAEERGEDSDEGEYFLIDWETKKEVEKEDIVMNWKGKKMVLGMRKG